MPPLLQLQKLPGKGIEGGKKASLRRFLADEKIVLGHPIARATSYYLLPDTFIRASKMSLKLAV